MSLLQQLRAFFQDRHSRVPPGFVPQGAEQDPLDMMTASPPAPQPGVAGLRLGLVYTDGTGVRSHRVVHLKRLLRTHHGYYFTAHCELRNEARTFALSQVAEVVDYRSGEHHESPESFFKALLGRAEWQENIFEGEPTDTDRVITGCADGLCVLLYFADADGKMHKNERHVIKQYMNWRIQQAGLPTKYNKEMLERFIEGTVPDSDDFSAAVVRLVEDDRIHAAKVAEFARRLVIADRVLDDEERARLAKLADIILEQRPN